MPSPKITRSPVESSNIKAMGYDESTRTLEVEFKNSHIYQYTPVSPAGYKEFIQAPSIGKHFHTHIRLNTTLNIKRIT